MKGITKSEMSKQTVGNAGLYHVCFELSKRNWNVSITSRNAKGVDIIAYSVDGKRKITLQVKTFRATNHVALGKEKTILADYLVICTNILANKHVDYILKSDDLGYLETKHYENQFYLSKRAYTNAKYKNNWGIIGDAL